MDGGLRWLLVPWPWGCIEMGSGRRASARSWGPPSSVCPPLAALRCSNLLFQPFLSLLMDQWQRQQQQRLWFEGQVRPSGVGVQGAENSSSHPWTMAPPPGSTPSRTGGFLGTTSPGPMAELYGAANQDSGVSSYISAASPAPSTGFGHSLGVSGQARRPPPPFTLRNPKGPLIATAFTNGYH
ncbi:hypothetical protein GHT09_001376 [Marmota monax]|uniref:Uncharacterized protein n=1 Tax=Marmota monax TaxID=9995 RepID=A0A834R2X0_MARMO|nr:hypothetical protein GHT09_001376 [Marmota monax]